jgi:hypothetical protein
MADGTITLKFDDADPRSQHALKRDLNRLCRSLVAEGAVSGAHAHAVFPGDPDRAMATMFMIELISVGSGDVGAALRLMRNLPGVQYAEMAAQRRTTQTAHAR